MACCHDDRPCASCDKALIAAEERGRREGAAKAIEALEAIRGCVGADDPGRGMDAPEDVWGLATCALALLKEPAQCPACGSDYPHRVQLPCTSSQADPWHLNGLKEPAQENLPPICCDEAHRKAKAPWACRCSCHAPAQEKPDPDDLECSVGGLAVDLGVREQPHPAQARVSK